MPLRLLGLHLPTAHCFSLAESLGGKTTRFIFRHLSFFSEISLLSLHLQWSRQFSPLLFFSPHFSAALLSLGNTISRSRALCEGALDEWRGSRTHSARGELRLLSLSRAWIIDMWDMTQNTKGSRGRDEARERKMLPPWSYFFFHRPLPSPPR